MTSSVEVGEKKKRLSHGLYLNRWCISCRNKGALHFIFVEIVAQN